MRHQYMTCDICSKVIEDHSHSAVVQTNLFNGRKEHLKTKLYDLCMGCYATIALSLDAKRPPPVQEA